METPSNLRQEHREFEDKGERVRKRDLQHLQKAKNKIKQIQPDKIKQIQPDKIKQIQPDKIKQIQPDKIKQIQPEGYAAALPETFAWTTVPLVASYSISLVSGIILAPLIGFFIGGANAFLIAYVALPMAVVLRFNNSGHSVTRVELFAFAIIEGVLTGFLLSERYLATIQPLGFVTPLLIAIIRSIAVENIGNAIVSILGSTIASVVYHLLFEVIVNQFSHVFLVLLYATIGWASVLYPLKNRGHTGRAFCAILEYGIAVVYAQLIVFTVFGGLKELVPE